jgi:hypothetical protein
MYRDFLLVFSSSFSSNQIGLVEAIIIFSAGHTVFDPSANRVLFLMDNEDAFNN